MDALQLFIEFNNDFDVEIKLFIDNNVIHIVYILIVTML